MLPLSTLVLAPPTTVGLGVAVFSSKGNKASSSPARQLLEVQPRVGDVVEALLRLAPQTPSKNPLMLPGVRSGSAAQSGSLVRIAARTSVTVSPSKARFPVSIS